MKQVVVAVIEQNIDNMLKYLLVASKKDFGEFTHFYYPPGGHVEEGETVEEALRRESVEELGTDIINPTFLCESIGDVANQITYWYKASLPEGVQIVMDEETLHNAGFFSLEDMRTMNLWPATRRYLRSILGCKILLFL